MIVLFALVFVRFDIDKLFPIVGWDFQQHFHYLCVEETENNWVMHDDRQKQKLENQQPVVVLTLAWIIVSVKMAC